MPWTMKDCAAAVAETGLRFHHDEAEQVIRLVFVTSCYRNRRGEHLAVVTLALPDAGQRLRLSIERAIDPGGDPAAVCLAACRFAAAVPLVGVEYDADFDNLRLVVEATVDRATINQEQLRIMIDRLVDAAELWQAGWGSRQHGSQPPEPREKAA